MLIFFWLGDYGRAARIAFFIDLALLVLRQEHVPGHLIVERILASTKEQGLVVLRRLTLMFTRVLS